jgi:hypothetical protein
MCILVQSEEALSAVSKRLDRAKGACVRRLHNLVTLHTSEGQENHLSREKENAGTQRQLQVLSALTALTCMSS